MFRDFVDFISDYIVLVIFIIVILAAWSYGEYSYDKRCAKAFPDISYAQHEQCIKHLRDGGTLIELEEKASE